MYFKEKENTNIDSEFDKKKLFNFKGLNLKTIMLLVCGLIVVLIITFIIISSLGNKKNYTIELTAGDKITINLNSEYIEPGYIAYDQKKTDVTEYVKVINNVDTTKPGEYEITYQLGKIKKIRYVTVAEVIEKTYIYLHGEANAMYLEVGEIYTEPGYTASDTIDGNLTDQVKVTGTVDTKKIGTYKLVYSVINSKGIETTTTRNVIVVAKGKKPNNK